MIYYKAFKRDMTCKGFQFKEGEIYEIKESPVLCERGFHFCRDLVLTLTYYPVTKCITENCYAEIEVLGDVIFEEPTRHKGVTNKIKIVRIIPDGEMLSLVDDRHNSGNGNSGHGNSGYNNSGDNNSGSGNSGNDNSGKNNSGDWNSGNNNSGSNNSGRSNSGNYNSCNNESGYFNTVTPELVRVFNKPCLKTDWDTAKKPSFLYFDMNEGESYKDAFQRSFKQADERQIALLKALPNFDPEVFFEISGIDLRG